MAKAQDVALSRRVMVMINRDVTTKTPIIVWEHEIPLLEAVHGEGTVQLVEKAVEQLDEGFKAQRGDIAKRSPSKNLGLEDVFDGDPRAEYDRLGVRYGMHDEVKMPIVEYVYGRFDEGRFAKLVGTAGLEQLSERQLRNKLDELKVAYPPNAPLTELRKMVETELAAA